MPRIAGINIPDNKQISVSLTYIYGIGKSSALKILKEANIPPEKKAKELTEKEINQLRKIIEENYKIEGDLRREVISHIKRLKEIKCWRGLRHIKGLPVRGQKTRKNSRTVRGNIRKTVGSGRKAPPAPK
jgi:small subunit ribosomal protein S13